MLIFYSLLKIFLTNIIFQIELDFSIPFLNIPVKGRTTNNDGTSYPVIDINTRGLVTVGAIFLFLLTVVPKLLQIFIPQAHGEYQNYAGYDFNGPSIDSILHVTLHVFH